MAVGIEIGCKFSVDKFSYIFFHRRSYATKKEVLPKHGYFAYYIEIHVCKFSLKLLDKIWVCRRILFFESSIIYFFFKSEKEIGGNGGDLLDWCADGKGGSNFCIDLDLVEPYPPTRLSERAPTVFSYHPSFSIFAPTVNINIVHFFCKGISNGAKHFERPNCP
jgi:hypothetical protein